MYAREREGEGQKEGKTIAELREINILFLLLFLD